MKPKRIEILGVPADCIDMNATLALVDEMISGDGLHTIIAVNPEKIMKCQEDEKILSVIRKSSLLIPDGIGVVFAARLLGLCRMQRVPGSELMPALCARAAQKGYKIFLFGASPQVNACAVEKLLATYPGLDIVGHQHGYVAEDEMPALVERINASGAQILFIALGSPKQELWMDTHRDALKVKICQGVGGTFDVLCGTVKRAPAAFRRVHLEWLYRLLSQPRRLLRQSALPRFSWRVLAVVARRSIGRA
jgi:N-acetylglucosaminyldiphosphoundecaprenol N-acetyl-beta-D-mannosaminyltransferase